VAFAAAGGIGALAMVASPRRLFRALPVAASVPLIAVMPNGIFWWRRIKNPSDAGKALLQSGPIHSTKGPSDSRF